MKVHTASRVDTIRQLLDQRHICVEGTDSFGKEPADTRLTPTITDVAPYRTDKWFQRIKEHTF